MVTKSSSNLSFPLAGLRSHYGHIISRMSEQTHILYMGTHPHTSRHGYRKKGRKVSEWRSFSLAGPRSITAKVRDGRQTQTERSESGRGRNLLGSLQLRDESPSFESKSSWKLKKKEVIPPPMLPITLQWTIVATHQPEYSSASIY